ncbi:MAG TPA: mechanosensitive ion channel domain-containing protein [Burkholderiales bacterium]|nr:mechanosensitive ion channel domain-containing protein [Burkholderiales bacterium]
MVAWLLQAIAARIIRGFRSYMARRTSAADELRRIDTVGTAFRYFATVIVVLVAGTLVLGELGISVAPILATAGVAGVAIGFGAQSLIKDYFTGFFLLLEDQIREGDVVEIIGKAGEVEEVTLRYVRLRDGDGYVHFIPNGEIKSVTNRTRAHAYATIDAAIQGHEFVEAGCAAMRAVAGELRKDEKYAPMILADVEVFGIERWELWGIGLRCRIKVVPHQKDTVRREFTRRLVAEFDRRQIKSP